MKILLLILLFPNVFAFNSEDIELAPFDCSSGVAGDCPSYQRERTGNFITPRALVRDPYQRCLEKEEFSVENIFDSKSPIEMDKDFNDNDFLFHGVEFHDFAGGCVEGFHSDSQLFSARAERISNLTESLCGDQRGEIKENCENTFEGIASREFNGAKVAIADNYLSHLKVRTGIEESLRSANLIGLMYGENVAENINCQDLPYPQSSQACNLIKSGECNQSQMAAQIKQEHLDLSFKTVTKLRELRFEKIILRREINDLSLGVGHTPESAPPEIAERFRKLEAIDEMEALFKAQAPWVEGAEFKKFDEKIENAFESNNEEEFKRVVEEALEKQMKANKENLLSQMDKFKEAALCLRGVGTCEREEVDKIIANTPPLDLDGIDVPHRNSLKFAQCLEEEAVHVNFNENLIKEVAIGAGLTIASIFVPPLGIARVASLGSQLLRGTGSIARLKTAGTLTGMTGIVAADIMYAAESFDEAVRQCSGEKQVQLTFENGVRPSSTSAPSCDQENAKLNARAETLPNSCMSSILFASLDAIPFASFATSSTLTAARLARTPKVSPPPSVFSAAEIARNRTLRDEDRVAQARRLGILGPTQDHRPIIDSHNHFGPSGNRAPSEYAFGSSNRRRWLQEELNLSGADLDHAMTNYTQAELIEKARILRDGGFTQEQIRRCLASGICGHTPPNPLRNLSFPTRTTDHPEAAGIMTDFEFETNPGPFQMGTRYGSEGARNRRELKIRMIAYYESIGDIEKANFIRSHLGNRNVPNVFVEFDLSEPGFEGSVYIKMLRNGSASRDRDIDMPIAGAGNFFLRKLARENPGKDIVSSIAYDNAARFKNAFKEIASEGAENISPARITELLQNIPAVRSLPGRVKFQPKFNENGEIVDLYVVRTPDLSTSEVLIEGVDSLIADPKFSKWMETLTSRPEEYFSRTNSTF